MVISQWNIGEGLWLLDKTIDKCTHPASTFRLGGKWMVLLATWACRSISTQPDIFHHNHITRNIILNRLLCVLWCTGLLHDSKRKCVKCKKKKKKMREKDNAGEKLIISARSANLSQSKLQKIFTVSSDDKPVHASRSALANDKT